MLGSCSSSLLRLCSPSSSTARCMGGKTPPQLVLSSSILCRVTISLVSRLVFDAGAVRGARRCGVPRAGRDADSERHARQVSLHSDDDSRPGSRVSLWGAGSWTVLVTKHGIFHRDPLAKNLRRCRRQPELKPCPHSHPSSHAIRTAAAARDTSTDRRPCRRWLRCSINSW